jgi:hypothetical protein
MAGQTIGCCGMNFWRNILSVLSRLSSAVLFIAAIVVSIYLPPVIIHTAADLTIYLILLGMIEKI